MNVHCDMQLCNFDLFNASNESGNNRQLKNGGRPGNKFTVYHPKTSSAAHTHKSTGCGRFVKLPEIVLA